MKSSDAGETTQGLLIYYREGGLTPEDEEKIASDADELQALADEDPDELPLIDSLVPFSGAEGTEELVSPEGDLAYTVLIVPTDFEKAADWGENVRDTTGDGEDGLEVLLSGDLGFSTDAEEVFADFDLKLLIATACWSSSSWD